MKFHKWILLALFFSSIGHTASYTINGRIDGMGGAGTVVADLTGAGFYNPAMAALSKEAMSVLFPAIGVGLQDPNDFINDLEDFKTVYNTFQSDPVSAVNRQNTANALNNLKNKTGYINGGFGGAVGMNSSALAGVFFIKGYTEGIVVSEIDDVDITNINSGNVTTLNSKGRILGFAITDIGLAFSKNFTIAGQDVALGVSPKLQRFYSYHYEISVNNFTFDDWNSDSNKTEEKGVNLDLGAVWHRGPYRFGATLTNFFSHDIQTAVKTRGYTYKVSPLLTLGGAYASDYLTLAADLDLNTQERFDPSGGPDIQDNTRYLRMGAEVNAWGWLQARVGYRHDMEGSFESAMTIGIGISPFNATHLDIAAELIDKNSFAGTLQLSFTY